MDLGERREGEREVCINYSLKKIKETKQIEKRNDMPF